MVLVIRFWKEGCECGQQRRVIGSDGRVVAGDFQKVEQRTAGRGLYGCMSGLYKYKYLSSAVGLIPGLM